eukprot:s1388_g7.t1
MSSLPLPSGGSMDGEGAEEDRKNKKTPKDKKDRYDKKGKDGKEQAEQESTDVPAAAVGAVTADSSPSAGVEVKPKKLKAKKEKKDKKAEPLDPEDDLQGRPEEAKDAEGEPEPPEPPEDRPAPDDGRPSDASFSHVAEPPVEPPGEGEEAEAEAEADAAERGDEPRASDPAVQHLVGEQPAGEEETGETEDFPEVRVALPDDEVEPLMGSEHRRSQVPSVPAEDVVTGPPPLQLGKGSGLAHDINIPEREAWTKNDVEGPRRYSLTGQESVRRCIECDLVWDMSVTHCSRCQKQLVEGSIQAVTEFLNGSQLEFLEQAFKRYDVDGSGRLDGKELRMAVRELGWDTKQDILDRWARVGGNQGLNLDQFKNLIASGKLGRKTFKPITGKASQAVKDERRQLLAMGGQSAWGDVTCNVAFGGDPCQSVFEELPAHRKLELIEAWAFWDADHSGFLEPIELMNASKGLGFHLPIESVVAVCGKHGGGIDQENFVRVMSVQIKHRDEELGLWKGANALPLEEGLDDEEDRTGLQIPRHIITSWFCAACRVGFLFDKNFRWRNLLCTSHATVGEYAIGVRLYFDLLLLLVIAFGVLTATTLPFLLTLDGSGGSPAADATVHIMNEFFGSMALLGVLLLYRFVIIHRATYTTNSRNLANLAIQVRGLPTDLGYHHLGYEELLREHFQTVAYEQALRMGTERELDDQPVREVVLWRNYDAAVHGVLRQVELQAKQFSVNTELKFLEQKAREHDLSEELEHDLGYNAGVAYTQRALEDWPQELPESLTARHLLQPQVVSATDVFVPFRSRGMHMVVVRYSPDEREVQVGVDTKMKNLERGHGVATLNILVKDQVRNTTLKHGSGKRVQGRAYTTRAVPFPQAVMSDEGTENHVRLFRLACELWSHAKPDSPPLAELVTQVHKDFAPGIEAARRRAARVPIAVAACLLSPCSCALPLEFPLMPSAQTGLSDCDDWFHFKQERKTLESKCRK